MRGVGAGLGSGVWGVGWGAGWQAVHTDLAGEDGGGEEAGGGHEDAERHVELDSDSSQRVVRLHDV